MVNVLVVSALMSMLMTAMITMFKYQTDTARQIAGKSGITDLSTGMGAFFSGANCSSTGTFRLGGAPAAVSASGTSYSLAMDTVLFATGGAVISSLNPPEITTMINPYTVAQLDFAPVGVETATTLGFVYPFKMDVSFASPKGAPPRPLSKFINIFTDSTRKVLGACYSNAGGNGLAGPGRCYFADWGASASPCQTGYTNRGTSGFILSTPSCPYFNGVQNGAQLGPGLPWWWCHAFLCCAN